MSPKWEGLKICFALGIAPWALGSLGSKPWADHVGPCSPPPGPALSSSPCSELPWVFSQHPSMPWLSAEFIMCFLATSLARTQHLPFEDVFSFNSPLLLRLSKELIWKKLFSRFSLSKPKDEYSASSPWLQNSFQVDLGQQALHSQPCRYSTLHTLLSHPRLTPRYRSGFYCPGFKQISLTRGVLTAEKAQLWAWESCYRVRSRDLGIF